MEKAFVDGCKIAKFVKVFSLESFPLYDMLWCYMHIIKINGFLLFTHMKLTCLKMLVVGLFTVAEDKLSFIPIE